MEKTVQMSGFISYAGAITLVKFCYEMCGEQSFKAVYETAAVPN